MTDTSGREKVLEDALRQIANASYGKCPFDDKRFELDPKKPCPVCGDLGVFEDAEPSKCHQGGASARARAALASPSTQEPALRGGKVEEIARIELTLRKALSFKDAEWVLAAIRTYTGESAAQSERAGLEVSEATVLRKNFAEYLVSEYQENPCLIASLCDEQLDRSGALLGYVRDAALSVARKAGGE